MLSTISIRFALEALVGLDTRVVKVAHGHQPPDLQHIWRGVLQHLLRRVLRLPISVLRWRTWHELDGNRDGSAPPVRLR